MKRREFVQGVAVAGAAVPTARAEHPTSGVDAGSLARQGPKPAARGQRAVAASQSPDVTRTMLQVMKNGGNAIDAAVAGCLIQATVQMEMTNHTGSVNLIYWEAKSGKAYELNSSGVLVSGLPAFRPLPPNLGVLIPAQPPCACIPGFMPAMKAMHERFGTTKWDVLCAPAIEAAESGHLVSSFEYGVLQEELPGNTYFPSAREVYVPDGVTPQVGDRFKNPRLAATLRRLAKEGPDDFITGQWAREFVAEGNRLGWPVKLDHMNAVPPRWGEPLRHRHGDHEILQLSPPERQGAFCALVLGILRELGISSLGHYAQSADSLYYFAHALRFAEFEMGFVHDPQNFDVPLDVWLSREHHRQIAEILKRSRPKIDLTEHVKLASGKPALVAAGMGTAGPLAPPTYRGSCELAIVDREGNWVQMMNTLQSGGIPGVAVGGVPMVGSHAVTDMRSAIAGWLTGGGRIRSTIGNTMVLKNGKPWLSLGTPGNVHVTIPQVLSSILDFGMDPAEAASVPRMLSLRDDYVLPVESRIAPPVVAGLARLGLQIQPLPPFDYHMGSFQMAWRDERTGLLNSSVDPRRAGEAGGL